MGSLKALGGWLLWVLAAALALQLFFVARTTWMLVGDPGSTAFQRSEAWRLAHGEKPLKWAQTWVPYSQLSPHLKRAVIASEDGSFTSHDGVDWEAIESAWTKNAKRVAQAERRAAQARNPATVKPARIVGGSTITQQLAKNLWLSGERYMPRKAQELVMALVLETVLDKRRILEIYLNSVEWGEGVFGAEAAAQRYFRKSARHLNPHEAARLAVMLPSPKFFETRQGSPYLAGRTATIVARMPDATPP